jgi:hypothetical protein
MLWKLGVGVARQQQGICVSVCAGCVVLRAWVYGDGSIVTYGIEIILMSEILLVIEPRMFWRSSDAMMQRFRYPSAWTDCGNVDIAVQRDQEWVGE